MSSYHRLKSVRGRNSVRNIGRKTRSFKRLNKVNASMNANNISKELGVLGAMLGANALYNSQSTENENEGSDRIHSIVGGGDDSIVYTENINDTKTMSSRRVSKTKSIDASLLILQFLEMLNTIKIFHWSTLSYPSHKATDDLHSKMSELVDSFIEQYIGSVGAGKTPVFKSRNIPFCCCKSIDVFRNKLTEYKTFLISLSDRLANVTELLNIRDEMLGAIDQTIYLLRLK